MKRPIGHTTLRSPLAANSVSVATFVALAAAVLTLAGCGGSGGTAPPAGSDQGGSADPTAVHLGVRSSLDGTRSLPQRIHWTATTSVPSTQIAQVDFLIDGHLAWVEHNAPYYYADDGNWLVPTFLRPGKHAFTVRVSTVQGKAATDKVVASVIAPPAPPFALRGSWTRMVTPSDVTKATSGQAPPPGRWKLRIVAKGWQLHDPTPQGTWGLFDVAYQPNHRLQMRPTIEYPPYPNSNKGGFCEDTDPLATWTYTVTNEGKTLNLHPTGHDPCGDRAAILEGTWSRQ